MKLLIVDDEQLEIDGMRAAVSYELFGFNTIFTASNTESAKEILLKQNIELVLCDIEMPGGTGIDLFKWSAAAKPTALFIFITCHGELEYVKPAIQMGGFDYLLKPVKPAELSKVLTKAIERINKNEKNLLYDKLLHSGQNLMLEQFWSGLALGKIPQDPRLLEAYAQKLHLREYISLPVIPVLIRIQKYGGDISLLKVLMHNLADEIMLPEDENGIMFFMPGNDAAILFYDLTTRNTVEDVHTSMSDYLDRCVRYFEADMCVYIEEKATAEGISGAFKKMARAADENIAYSNRVFIQEEMNVGSQPDAGIPVLSELGNWKSYLRQGESEIVLGTVRKWLSSSATVSAIKKSDIYVIREEFMREAFDLLKSENYSLEYLFSSEEFRVLYNNAVNSTAALEQWFNYFITLMSEAVKWHPTDLPVTDQIKRYIDVHVDEEMTYDTIAAEIHLNPVYLNRMFKQKEGISIAKYIQTKRMKVARDLLVHTNMTVGLIATRVGYSNFSQFSRVFRQHYQTPPTRFRKMKES